MAADDRSPDAAHGDESVAQGTTKSPSRDAANVTELERLRGLLAEANAVLHFFNEGSPDREIATPEERTRWIMRYDGIVAALDNEASYAKDGFPL